MPADAPIYAQVTLRPKGKLKSDVEALATTVSGFEDPVGRLIEDLEESANEEPTLSGKRISFEQDIDPWLGETAGIFATGFSEDPGAGIVQMTDPEAAQQFIDDTKQQGDEEATYKGTDYGLDDGTAYGVLGDFLCRRRAGLQAVVDVSEGEDSLGDQSEFTDALDQAPRAASSTPTRASSRSSRSTAGEPGERRSLRDRVRRHRRQVDHRQRRPGRRLAGARFRHRR